MFLSTTIPSFMFNVTKSNGMSPYEFSVPYNFVPGRNINITITPKIITSVNNNTWVSVRDYLNSSLMSAHSRINVIIPDSATTYTTNMKFNNNMGAYTTSPSAYFSMTYSVDITCDVVNNKITFTPVAFTVNASAPTVPADVIAQLDVSYTAPVLLVISTNS